MHMLSEDLSTRLDLVRERIERACRRSQRSPSEVQLVAVSKRQPVERIREAYALGVRDFGENYPQELAAKRQQLGDLPDLRFHMIGHVQSNKVNLVLRHANVLHTLDSTRLVDVVERRTQRDLPVYIAVNVAGEPQKHGCRPEELRQLVERVMASSRLTLEGLMAIPPAVSEPELSRPHFEALHALAQRFGLRGLSMGMSADFEIAIEAGATVVRLGTVLFGSRSA
jgi:PLP dependent protein